MYPITARVLVYSRDEDGGQRNAAEANAAEANTATTLSRLPTAKTSRSSHHHVALRTLCPKPWRQYFQADTTAAAQAKLSLRTARLGSGSSCRPRECTLHAMTRTHNMLVNAPVAVRCVV
jgi:hypothetical protein